MAVPAYYFDTNFIINTTDFFHLKKCGRYLIYIDVLLKNLVFKQCTEAQIQMETSKFGHVIVMELLNYRRQS